MLVFSLALHWSKLQLLMLVFLLSHASFLARIPLVKVDAIFFVLLAFRVDAIFLARIPLVFLMAPHH